MGGGQGAKKTNGKKGFRVSGVHSLPSPPRSFTGSLKARFALTVLKLFHRHLLWILSPPARGRINLTLPGGIKAGSHGTGFLAGRTGDRNNFCFVVEIVVVFRSVTGQADVFPGKAYHFKLFWVDAVFFSFSMTDFTANSL